MPNTAENTRIVDGKVVTVGRQRKSTRTPIAERLNVTPATSDANPKSTRRQAGSTRSSAGATSTRGTSTRQSTRQKPSTRQKQIGVTSDGTPVKVTPAFERKGLLGNDSPIIRHAKTLLLFALALLLFAIGFMLLSTGQDQGVDQAPTEQSSSPNTSTNTGILRNNGETSE